MCVTYVPTWGYGVTSHVIYNGWSYVHVCDVIAHVCVFTDIVLP